MTSNAIVNAATLLKFRSDADPGNDGGYWMDDATPGRCFFLRDRIFIGGGAQYTGNKNAPLGGSWLTTLVANYFEKNAQATILTQSGKIGLVGAVSLTAGMTSGVAMGLAGVAYCNLAAGTARAGYFDATLATGTAVYGIEVATSNQGTDITANSYSAAGGVYGMKLGVNSGLGYVVGDASTAAPQAVSPSTAAFLIQAGTGAALPQQWRTGIIFASNALAGSDGTTGTAEAISFGKGHALNWYAGSAILAATIRSDVTASAGHNVSMIFSNDLVSFQDTAGVHILDLARDTAGAGGVNYLTLTSARTATSPTFQAAGSDANVGVVIKGKGTSALQLFTNGTEALRIGGNPSLAVNFLQATGSVTTAAPNLSALGTDTDIDVMLSPKGAGLFKVNYASTVATTPANFTADRILTFKDSTGTTYRIPCRASAW